MGQLVPPVPVWIFSGFLHSPKPGRQVRLIGSSNWVNYWLFVSVCQLCDGPATCQGFILPLVPMSAGFLPAPCATLKE